MRIYFLSLGCDKNTVDSQVMMGLINAEGYTVTDDEESADIMVINTCGFIADATREGIEEIIRLSEYKETGSCKGLIVTGCMVQRYKEEIFKELPQVDAILGTGDLGGIINVIKEVAKGEKVTNISESTEFNSQIAMQRMVTMPMYYGYLKIAEGCDNRCTYCTIPSIRGPYRSRTLESLVEEATMLANQGIKELILVAQDTSLYGIDLYGESKTHELLRKLSEIEGIEWLRILYCYPEHISDKLIEEMANNPKVCKYIDMPIQHADDEILKRMGRTKTTNKGLKDIIRKLREAMPEISIRTTLITGFPGETPEHFKTLTDFVEEMQFSNLGVFAYSREEGTPAYSMSGQVLKREKERRKNKIMSLQKKISSKLRKQQVGKTLEVMVDGRLEDGLYCGRSYADCYEIDGSVYFESDRDLISGEFVDVLITDSKEYDLMGEEVE